MQHPGLIIEDYEEEIQRQTKELPKPITRNEAVKLEEKPTFDSCISLLSEELKAEVVEQLRNNITR